MVAHFRLRFTFPRMLSLAFARSKLQGIRLASLLADLREIVALVADLMEWQLHPIAQQSEQPGSPSWMGRSLSDLIPERSSACTNLETVSQFLVEKTSRKVD